MSEPDPARDGLQVLHLHRELTPEERDEALQKLRALAERNASKAHDPVSRTGPDGPEIP